jgi:hypothetical protein
MCRIKAMMRGVVEVNPIIMKMRTAIDVVKMLATHPFNVLKTSRRTTTIASMDTKVIQTTETIFGVPKMKQRVLQRKNEEKVLDDTVDAG